MSVELHVILGDSRMPNVQRWQQEISALGFDVQLDAVPNLRAHTGFLPARLNGQSSGFEFHVCPARELLATYPELSKRSGERDKCANFLFGGDLSEMTCAMVASAALAKLADGIWFDPQDVDTQYSSAEAIALARSSNNAGARAQHRPTTSTSSKHSWFSKLFRRG